MKIGKTVVFSLGGMLFKYDEEKNSINIQKHGLSFRSAARVFFDSDRIEMFDEEHSQDEERYNTIGDTSAGSAFIGSTVIGNVGFSAHSVNDILFVVYTEKNYTMKNGKTVEVTRMISARLATNFERGLYYGKYV